MDPATPPENTPESSPENTPENPEGTSENADPLAPPPLPASASASQEGANAPPIMPQMASAPDIAQLTADDKTWAMLAHVSGPIASVVVGGMGFLGPLIIWLMKKETSPFVAEQAKEALNFELNMLAIGAVAAMATFVLTFLTLGLFICIAVPLLGAFALYVIIMPILAGIQANQGVAYRYPAIVRVIT